LNQDLDTIFALSSGRPPAAIAVIRISGPRSKDALHALIGRLPEPRRTSLAKVKDPATDEVIDEGLALWFPGPKSETGEDMAELQVHGGPAVIAAMLKALGSLDGLRLAEPGEFTRRAFESGRVDLTAVEGLADLIAAETEAQRKQALRQMQGQLAERVDAWRARLIEARALLEAGIDFSDEGDVPKNLVRQAIGLIRPVAQQIAEAAARGGERLREGLVVAIAGPPNAGKSTLLNRIARREAAIVSPYAGTTRDVIEVHLDLGGYPVTLLDTAGIRASDDPLEQEGVRRARARAAAADLVLWLVDVTAAAAPAPDIDAPSTWILLNKIDAIEAEQKRLFETPFDGAKQPVFSLSATTGRGVDSVLAALAQFAAEFFRAGESALITRERHRHMLDQAAAALEGALAIDQDSGSESREELLAEQVRLATRALERLTGRVDVEDVLDVIFREFCIGK
jgi:tRNA modification GTPase